MKRENLAGLMAALLSAGCAVLPPVAGSTQDALLRDWGTPSARHALPGGLERLEYASGPHGRTTWMVDLDAAGRVRQARQVLNEAEFEALMSVPELQQGEVLRRLGRPGERQSGGWQGGEIWSWRYPTHDCLWFQISLSAGGRVTGGGYAVDPTCDAGPDHL